MSQKILQSCRVCPRQCGADRTLGTGMCSGGEKVRVALASLHQWEEPCISLGKGSGTVFFSGCTLRCVYCQNYAISSGNFGVDITVEQLAQTFLSLQEKGACNINLVTPTHYTPQIIQALKLAKLSIPVVYNCSGYERVETLQLLEGLVDVYLTDLKYFDKEISQKYSKAPDYFQAASQAVIEMIRQTGSAEFDQDGRMTKGVLIRHLVLPGLVEQTRKLLDWIWDNLPHDIYISLMNQYFPSGQARLYPELCRHTTREEYDQAVEYLIAKGFENGFLQEAESAAEEYVPFFDGSGVVTD